MAQQSSWAKVFSLSRIHDLTQLDTLPLVVLLWTSDQHDTETSTWQHTNIHAPGGIQTHNPSMWVAADPHVRPRSHWDLTQLDTPPLVGLLWTSDQHDTETSTWQHTDIHAPGGIQTHNPSMWAAADPHVRPCSHWDRQVLGLVLSVSHKYFLPHNL